MMVLELVLIFGMMFGFFILPFVVMYFREPTEPYHTMGEFGTYVEQSGRSKWFWERSK
jgi:hypothetical protein